MRLSELISELERYKKTYGDMDVVLWDLDTAKNYVMNAKNIEFQLVTTHELRISIGLGSWNTPTAPDRLLDRSHE